jgi:hypothetical protein
MTHIAAAAYLIVWVGDKKGNVTVASCPREKTVTSCND